MDDDPGATVFSQRIAWLFEHRRKPDGSTWSGAEVSAAIKDRYDADLSATLINSLRRGASANPTRSTIDLLAAFFGVPAGIFFSDEDGQQDWERVQLGELIGAPINVGGTIPTRPIPRAQP